MPNSRSLELRPDPDANGTCVMYVMARDQRTRDNHALLAAQAEAIEHELPLVVAFNLLRSTGHRRREQYEFMIEGLKEVKRELNAKNIPFIITIGSMPEQIGTLAGELSPRTVYFDFSPLRGPRATQKTFARHAKCRVLVIDTHNIVPTWVTSDKEEFAAHTIRRKLHRLIGDWTVEPDTLKSHPHTLKDLRKGATWADVEHVVAKLPKSGIRHDFKPGEKAARRALKRFIDNGLKQYADGRNDALADAQSNLSPYLHYGQIAALRIVLDIADDSSHPPELFSSFKMPQSHDPATKNDSIDAFVEELVVRKELSDNFCLHNDKYDHLAGARDWAKKTLDSHKNDPREHIYTKQQLEAAETHDELWNAAQTQLTSSGKIHGYLRMYWAKKILEWTESPQTAVRWAIEMNDSYHLDGGDPNGYVGVLWSVAGVHDRPWFDREIYGTIRYMARSGADKKFDTKSYVQRWQKK